MAAIREPIVAGLLGCGHPHTVPHLQTLVTMPEVAAIHLWDPDPALAERLAAQAGDKPTVVHAALDGLLSDATVRWLLVALRNDLSADVLVACAAAGKPVLAEKPLGRSTAEVEPVVAAFRQRGVSLAVCYHNRYKPAARLIREYLAEGLLGRLCSAEGRLHTTQVGLRDPGHWLFDPALSGGGILPWLGCHWLDLLRYTSGAEVTSVTAHTGTLSGEAIGVEDLAVLTLGFEQGMLATGTFGYLMPGGQPGYLAPGYDTYLGFKGTSGWLWWDAFGAVQAVDAYSQHPAWLGASRRRVELSNDPAPAYGDRYGLRFNQDCLAAALDGRDGPATGEDMLAVWRIIEAAYESQRTGRRIELA